MTARNPAEASILPDVEEALEPVAFDFGLDRRAFVQVLGTGLLLAAGPPALAQRRPGRSGGSTRASTVAARLHLGTDGAITLLTGKIEGGQGARAELTQAAAEELGVAPALIQVIMGDTSQVPDDGITAGSRTTPSTLPAVRQAAAAARALLLDFAAQRWSVERAVVEIRDGKAAHPSTGRTCSYGDLAASPDAQKLLSQSIPSDVAVTRVEKWRVLRQSLPRPNRRDIVTGTHKFPSDVIRPGMLYGKILRPPSLGAKLASIDLGPAKAMPDVHAVRDEQFVGVAAPSTFKAVQALEAIAATATWEPGPAQPSSKEIFDHLKNHAQGGAAESPFADELAQAKHKLRQTYHVAYVQHAPLEPRAAVAEWKDGSLTVWTGTQNPFGYHRELMGAFRLPEDKVRVIVPDFGGGFGGKHTGEAAIEAARLAKAAGRPVCLRWTREEEFTWAYFRPAAVIEAEGTLDEKGSLTSWRFININSGSAALDTPYRSGKTRCRYVNSAAPLRQGSYRALAATANNFARESFIDELAHAAGVDPLQFRLAHLENERLRAVLEAAAKRFQWKERVVRKQPGTGAGLACGTEKGSFVAACVEVSASPGQILVRRVCEVFECGPVLNPDNLRAQVQGAILMGLGPALREEMSFENGRILNASFRKYPVPRFADVPELDIELLDRPDLPAVGGGETPIIAIAPAIANAVFQATGQRVRQMPIRLAT
jgi:isoquinoline 1-oxidoreductase subunit beta